MHRDMNSFSGISLVTQTIKMRYLFVDMKIEEEQLWHKPPKTSMQYCLPLSVGAGGVHIHALEF